MKRNNTAILLILRDHLAPYKIVDQIPQVQMKDCAQASPGSDESWVKVPDIISALWVVGKGAP